MEVLTIIAEVSIGLAGFGGVVLVLAKGPGEWDPADAIRIRFLLVAAFGALFSSLVPLGTVWGGASEATGIRWGSAVLLLFLSYWMAGGVRAVTRLEPEAREMFSPSIAILMLAVWLFASVGQLAVVLALTGPEVSRWLFFVGLLCPMAYAAFVFIRLIFVRPPER
jgi:hypothetical protein